ncbi:Broad-specificity phosphatase [Komagataella phaffii CBS 7435]|uniref:Phosphoglycerate mutase n=2 Tax=Komagataella phaffii TaxID=460519 RepID=C4QX32_KOMPG|nr:uncharacterized protein PAS_chr1-1_0427 [Komagataella phaffii GS115]AOA61012.1 GQ67_02219T0 [Komagataella phaffii]CAH2446604.1 Broad-specificity phosphatase [Komagataella phaffii CBS 7435]AOA66199.1 GQ68_02233T0 [Komagataella phaffii GS115]CAY67805.1 Putative protein of unknown function with some similarity to GPM1/YKL152C, a phosphoglycerate mutase [Komagataella phaffii GS115]CCA36888.1 Broad-specificity phosphatase [Komagataella phaffii CBS 7435]
MTLDNLTNQEASVLRIFIVRHGQTDHNRLKIMQGHLDTQLNSEGIYQAQKVGKRLASIPLDGILSSDLKRCLQTTQEILRLQNSTWGNIPSTSALRERNMGKAEGLPLSEALKQFGPKFRDLGESREKLLERLVEEWKRIQELGISRDYKNFLICTHGGVITNFINHLYSDLGYCLNPSIREEQLRVPYNTSITIIDVNKITRQGTIQLFGDTLHLGTTLKIVKDQDLR